MNSKIELLSKLELFPKISTFSNCNIIFITSIGYIEGQILNINDCNKEDFDNIDTKINGSDLIFIGLKDLLNLKEKNIDTFIFGDNGNEFIVMKNVVVKNSSNTYKLSIFVLFISEIIGFSFGQLEDADCI